MGSESGKKKGTLNRKTTTDTTPQISTINTYPIQHSTHKRHATNTRRSDDDDDCRRDDKRHQNDSAANRRTASRDSEDACYREASRGERKDEPKAESWKSQRLRWAAGLLERLGIPAQMSRGRHPQWRIGLHGVGGR